MENVIYNELIRRDIWWMLGQFLFEMMEQRLFSDDFIVNNLDQKIYIQSAIKSKITRKLIQKQKSLT
jgi:predicted AAA+ superfamily ATPase